MKSTAFFKSKTELDILYNKILYELPHKLSNDLKLQILRDQKILEKSQICVRTVSLTGKKMATAVKKYAKVDIKVS